MRLALSLCTISKLGETFLPLCEQQRFEERRAADEFWNHGDYPKDCGFFSIRIVLVNTYIDDVSSQDPLALDASVAAL